MIVDTLLINGTDIMTVPGLVVTDFSGMHSDGPYRGENLTVPGMPGAVSYAKVRDVYAFDIGVALTGDTRQDFLDCLAGLRALMPSNLVTLTRRLTDSGMFGYYDDNCSAEYVAGTAVTLLNANTGRTTLEFLNLSGGWS